MSLKEILAFGLFAQAQHYYQYWPFLNKTVFQLWCLHKGFSTRFSVYMLQSLGCSFTLIMLHITPSVHHSDVCIHTNPSLQRYRSKLRGLHSLLKSVLLLLLTIAILLCLDSADVVCLSSDQMTVLWKILAGFQSEHVSRDLNPWLILI